MSGSSLSDRGSRRRGMVFVALIVTSLVMLAVSDTGPISELRRGISFALAPVRDSLSDGTRSVTGVLDALGEVDALRRQNVELVNRVNALEDELTSLEVVRDQNHELSRVLGTRKALDHKTVAAVVVGLPTSEFERIIIIDRGSDDGIELGDPVVSEGGALAGSVVDVGPGDAMVQLITDTRSLVTGRDKRTRATGDVEGRLAAPLAMRKIKVTDQIAIGDLVVTAGVEGPGRRFRSSFPRGLPIGRIVDIQQDTGLVVQTALVQPEADLESLQMVLVITDHEGPVRRDRQAASES